MRRAGSAGRSAQWALAAAAAVAWSGAAVAKPYNPGHLDPASRDRVASICANVMRLSPGEEHFDGCMESLSDVEATLARGQAVFGARQACLSEGLSTGTPELAQCELESAGAHPMVTRAAAAAEPEPRSASSYFMAANAEIHRREELSCARLGIEPVASSFGGCVASLGAAMDAADNPAH